jgi:hypothetical protein
MWLISSKLLLAVDTGDGVMCISTVSGAVLCYANFAFHSDITCGATSACLTLLCTWTVPGENICSGSWLQLKGYMPQLLNLLKSNSHSRCTIQHFCKYVSRFQIFQAFLGFLRMYVLEASVHQNMQHPRADSRECNAVPNTTSYQHLLMLEDPDSVIHGHQVLKLQSQNVSPQ